MLERISKEKKRKGFQCRNKTFNNYQKIIPCSIDIRRWVKQVFLETKLLENFPPYSCRSASTAKALDMTLDILDTLKKGCLSNAKTFSEHYKK